ncbi:group II intron reverse transcriptase/maturase [Clostridium bowmanii]|uniref:group II intron reverse transcriptase/maturase n=1 Tax=Clostridium bowmanii TaxID=132925 RepID=UPI001C0C4C65|nr:group II intron reverse transcriptase/maturase [Clostridium bowmanii]MBU3189084.1 group II intron reverse transcriptase/maturase [Clostridium bowmanii]MCA1073815.1 group II intron reverse transcriptase/maturase [Clostridium bowmanii]
MNENKPNSVTLKNEAGANLDDKNLKVQWNTFDWKEAENVVNRLQTRITKATIEGNLNLVKKLQYMLVNNFYGKAIAIRKITGNVGSRTSGIDNELWDSPEKKMKNIYKLNVGNYKPKELKRVYIEKSNGKKRPLGIPTMYDRAMQSLYTLSLEPVAEATGDNTSYGFRKRRNTQDAREQIFSCMCKGTSAKWVLEGDIKGCFDNISHEWLIENVTMDKQILSKFLKAGYIYKNTSYRTDDGTPQGGVISPILANMALDGVETLLKEKYWKKGKTGTTISYRNNNNKVNYIRYADDFIIIGDSKENLEEIKIMIIDFMKIRGLELSEEKTIITHIDDGFDFLGWSFRKYNGKLLIKPSKKNQAKFMDNIRTTVMKNRAMSQEALIKKLNPIIRGWGKYHQGAVSREAYENMDNAIHETLWRWATRKHGKQSLGEIKDKYWKTIGTRNWVFCSENARLIKSTDYKIIRYPKLKLEMNPFLSDGKEYYAKRKYEIGLKYMSGKFKTIWERQNGLCCFCKLPLEPQGEKELHHIIPRKQGGDDTISNLAYCHTYCHKGHHGIQNIQTALDI